MKSGTKKIIATGSCWEYLTPKGKVNENSPLDKSNYFKASKCFCREIGDLMCKEYNADFTWLRLFYVFGRYQNNHSLIPFLITEAKKGKEPIPNNPYSKLDFINVKDVAEVIYQIIKSRNCKGIFNVGSGKATFVGDIVNKIRNYYGFEKLQFDNEKALNPNFYADSELINSFVEFSPSKIIDDLDNLLKA